ncbi:MAG: peptidase S8 [Chitinophagaceae bacterium]|nr:MAG: peptidase S8 [Chitinophagaceae bacterium]
MKKILSCTLLTIAVTFASQTLTAQKKEIPKGWHMMDATDSGYYGISINKAYDFVKSKNLKSTPVIVAVIDSGIDTLHEDLKPILWRNPKEIPGNGIDDDKNGYVDDVYGWNFLGSRDGRNVEKDSYEAARVYHQFKAKYDGKRINADTLKGDAKLEYSMWAKAKEDIVGDVNPLMVMQLRKMLKDLKAGDSIISADLKKEEYNCTDLGAYTPTVIAARKVKDILLSICKGNDNNEISNVQILNELEGELGKAEAADRAPKNFRNDIVGDNYDDINDRFYGNSNVMVNNSSALHGTHVAGIIAAAHNNGVGMDGVADNVRIMAVRAVPDGDEHDKDIALAIRYAVDNGARVINMSFGKGFSPNKKWVDEAVKYAEGKGVLLVHAAGNSAQNIDTVKNYPMPEFSDKTRATNWITVGASGPENKEGSTLTASFSNYGKKEVDVFAPGEKIYSTVPGGNTYQNLQGTSMASPVVAGLAAFILEYYPKLSPAQVKYVIEKSSRPPAGTVKTPGTGDDAPLSEISKSGGVINAFDAIKLASTLKPEGNNPKQKTKVKQKIRA